MTKNPERREGSLVPACYRCALCVSVRFASLKFWNISAPHDKVRPSARIECLPATTLGAQGHTSCARPIVSLQCFLACLSAASGLPPYIQDALFPDTCLECLPGTFSSQGQTFCTECGAGEYEYNSGSPACTPCEPGLFSNGTGTVQCSVCEAGSRSKSSSGSTACVSCEAGKFSSAGLSVCELCAPGFFSGSGASSCVGCAAGTASEFDFGSTACVTCEPGFSSKGAQYLCDACVPGKFQVCTALWLLCCAFHVNF